MKLLTSAFLLLLLVLVSTSPARAARLKDLVAIEGVRDNQLIGYGLVVGFPDGDRRRGLFSRRA
jgi:flagellar P-ring protein precursor FlgI